MDPSAAPAPSPALPERHASCTAGACAATAPPAQAAMLAELDRSCAKPRPRRRARLQAARISHTAHLTLGSDGLVAQQLSQIFVSEASQFGSFRQRLVDRT